ncbi:MAG: hypothetical protein C4329_00375, partial [Chitinophagaceae bacterium]
KPHFTENKKFLFDEAHRNFHRSNTTYAPFVNVLKNDGLRFDVNKKPFESIDLTNYNLVVIANPTHPKTLPHFPLLK